MHPFPTARGIISRPYRGRAGCIYCALCGSYGCEMRREVRHPRERSSPLALATGNVELRPRCMARSVEVDARGPREERRLPRRRRASSRSSRRSIVVVSCTAVESARLLLNSTLRRASRRGWPTAAGWWGKNLMFSSLRRVARHLPHRPSGRRSWPWLDGPGALRAAQPPGLLRDAGRRATASARAGRSASCGRTPTPSSRRSGWPAGRQGRLRQGAQGALARVPRLARSSSSRSTASSSPPPGTYVTVEPTGEGQVRAAGGGDHHRPAPDGPRGHPLPRRARRGGAPGDGAGRRCGA